MDYKLTSLLIAGPSVELFEYFDHLPFLGTETTKLIHDANEWRANIIYDWDENFIHNYATRTRIIKYMDIRKLKNFRYVDAQIDNIKTIGMYFIKNLKISLGSEHMIQATFKYFTLSGWVSKTAILSKDNPFEVFEWITDGFYISINDSGAITLDEHIKQISFASDIKVISHAERLPIKLTIEYEKLDLYMQLLPVNLCMASLHGL